MARSDVELTTEWLEISERTAVVNVRRGLGKMFGLNSQPQDAGAFWAVARANVNYIATKEGLLYAKGAGVLLTVDQLDLPVVVTRRFTPLASAGMQYYTTPTWTATGDFTVHFDIQPSGTGFKNLLGGSNMRWNIQSTNELGLLIAGTIRTTVNQLDRTRLQSIIVDRTGSILTVTMPGPVVETFVVPTDPVSINLIGLRNTDTGGTAAPLDGIIANVGLNEAGGDNRLYKLDEDFGTTTVAVDSIGGNNGTAINIAASPLFTEVADGWGGVELTPLVPTSLGANWADNGNETFTYSGTTFQTVAESSKLVIGSVYRAAVITTGMTTGSLVVRTEANVDFVSITTNTTTTFDFIADGTTLRFGSGFSGGGRYDGTFKLDSLVEFLEVA